MVAPMADRLTLAQAEVFKQEAQSVYEKVLARNLVASLEDNKRLREALDNICSWTLTGFVHNKHQAIVEARELLKQYEYREDKK